MTAPFRYYGCENSHFSAKVRPALRSKGIHFAERGFQLVFQKESARFSSS